MEYLILVKLSLGFWLQREIKNTIYQSLTMWKANTFPLNKFKNY